MRARVAVSIAALALIGIAVLIHPAGKDYRSTIVDVSWPNCGAKTMDVFATGIVGVTGGLDFHPNPCAGEEAGWFSHYAVYINTGYPGRAYGQKYKSSLLHCGIKQDVCLAYSYGYNAALYAIRQANLQNVHADMWWLDVETENSWTDNFLVNRQFIRGAEAAIKQNVWSATAGIYSSRTQWNEIMGPWQNKLPVWWATGAKNKAGAAKWCREKSFTGGPVWLSQYTIKYDENFTCSGQFTQRVTNTPPQPATPETIAQ
jgi:hypothetical protein